jgi:flagellar motor component MotA
MSYFEDNWNSFDLFIVIGASIGIVVKYFLMINIGGVTTIMRAMRVGRIFKLIKKAKALKQIFDTFIKTLPSLGNIGGLLGLFLFIFSILGQQMFGQIIFQEA